MKYCVLTFGCRANQADSCDIECQLRASGGMPASPEAADLVVVNTCTVTSAADQAARSAIRRIARLNPTARVVATGCYATRRPDEVAQLPGVLQVVPNSVKPGIAGSLTSAATSLVPRFASSPVPQFPSSPVPDQFPLRPGSRGRTALPLRVQTGCDERCAYCIVPSTRGAGTSRPLEAVVGEMRMAADAGFKELWVTGVHLGSYGRDLRPALSLLDLLVALDRASAGADVTFRLSSLEPMDCSDDLLDCLAESPRFLPHLHLPLQHAGDRMLAAMRRPYTRERFQSAVDGVRRRLPDAAIGTDLIAGFPGETDRDFEEQADYLRGSPLTHVHVFPYSDRPGTEASRMAAKVPGPEIRRRANLLRAIAADLNTRFIERQVGWERAALTLDAGTVALTDNYIKLRIPAGRRRNQRLRVRVASVRPPSGEVVE
jgi:threonylcarbamoyladenosine tRNA methylthiotransferase MtaB